MPIPIDRKTNAYSKTNAFSKINVYSKTNAYRKQNKRLLPIDRITWIENNACWASRDLAYHRNIVKEMSQ